MEADQEGVDDLVELAEISEKAIAANLYVRLKKETIYTYIGRVLIAVNPFKVLHIYGPDAVDFYRGGGETEQGDEIDVPDHDDRATRCTTAQLPQDILENRRRSLHVSSDTMGQSGQSMFKNCKGPKPPHLYALTNTMYHNMMMEHENQCVIISGESGAGKTVSAKHIMNFIAKASGKGSEKVEHIKDIIIQSNPLLEAFGNAKTMRNNNSSRFGKFMEIQFNFSGHPDGGKISNFLLEKSRVVHLNKNERNYHVFYQLLSGCPKEQHNDFGFEFARPEFYFYLNQTGVYTVDGTNDAEDYNCLRQAMSVVGFNSTSQSTILKLVSAILHLGNINFKEENNVAVPVSDNMLTVPARLLSVDKDLLKEKLVSSIMEARWGGKVEVTKKTNNADQALQARDALAKALYSQVFDYLVQGINEAMQKDKDEMSIGVLDIYGFEIFETFTSTATKELPERTKTVDSWLLAHPAMCHTQHNQFEQFAINFVNEKLQQIFIELTLKMEQEEYVQEGITWQEVKYFNNKTVCELIESKRPPGIMCTLDDVCSTMHAVSEGSEKTLMEKLRAIVASNKDFSRYFRAQSNYFTITHYAGNVDYEAKGFCEKNKDVLSNDMIALMQSSEDAFVRDLFPAAPSNESTGRRAKSNTAGAKIKSQAAALIDKIMTCTPHYVRCIKPSESKQPLDWDDQRVLHQINYLGLKENIRVRRAGFAFRRQFQQIICRYGIISPQVHKGWDGDPAEGCRVIMNDAGIDPSKWQAGKTKLFLKEPSTLNELEDVKNRILEKYCITIQGTYRAYRLRKRFQNIRKGVAVIQRAYRRHRERSALDKLITIKKLLQGVDVLGDRKRRRASWDMGFKGDYMDFQNNKPLQNVITGKRVEFAAEVKKYSRDGKEQFRILVLTGMWLYIIGELKSTQKLGDVAYKVKRRLHMADINSVTVSPHDDSFFVLHAKDYDNLFDCPMLPEALNRLAVVYKLENDCELHLNVAESVDCQIKGGGVRHIHFLEKGTSRLKTSPSKKTFTIAASIVDHPPEEDIHVPGITEERRVSIELFVDKVARKLSRSYSVQVPDPRSFTAVAKAIFGPSGGGIQCKGVFVDLPEGSLTSHTKEVCIQLCKNKSEAVPLSEHETVISRVVELSPRDKPLQQHVALCLPLDDVSWDGFERFLRWTPTQSGEKANWRDVRVSDAIHGKDEDQTFVELRHKKAKVNTKVFGIFCIVSSDLNQNLEHPRKESNTSDAIKAYKESSNTSLLQRFQSAHTAKADAHGSTVQNNLTSSSSHHKSGWSFLKRMSIMKSTSKTTSSKSKDNNTKHSIFKAKSRYCDAENNFKPSQATELPSPPTAPTTECPSSLPPVQSTICPPLPSAAPATSSSLPPPHVPTSSPASEGPPPPPPPPPPSSQPPESSAASSSGTDNSFAAMLQARKANIIG